MASADAVPDVADATLDAVISTMVMEHVPNESAYLAEIRRVLRTGGRAYVTTVFKKQWAWYFRKRDGSPFSTRRTSASTRTSTRFVGS